jgi:exopolyphosphatase / guanosine-5'-triphosphate,3'-diphosphate pyrophosphatase
MQAARRAVIDVGTNSVKLLVAEVAGQAVHPVWEEARQTRLGEGFYNTHRISAHAIRRTAESVAEFAATARARGAESPRVIATSAARDAVNQHELIEAVRSLTGLTLEVISGDQEAEWAYQGVATGEAFKGQRLLIMDAGGGSTEFILGQGDHPAFQQSFPIGALRLLEKFPPSDPPQASQLQACRNWLREFIEARIKPALGPQLPPGRPGACLVGTGGTAAILAKMELSLDGYDRERIESVRLGAPALSRWVERLWSLPLAERRGIPGLPPPRADVILPGAIIYEGAMSQLGFAELRISTRGLRCAAVMGLPARTADHLITLPDPGAPLDSGRARGTGSSVASAKLEG